MKRLFVLIAAVALFAGVQAQQLVQSINAATYQAKDTTVFTLGIPRTSNMVIVEFTGLNATDAVLYMGYGVADKTIFIASDVTGNPFTLDNTSASNLSAVKNEAGVNYNKYVIAVGADIWRGNYCAIKIIWNSVTSGTINVYY